MIIKDYLSTKDIAEILGVSKRQVYRNIKSGKLKAFKVGHRTVKVAKEDLKLFLANSRIPSQLDFFEEKNTQQ